MNYTQIKQIKKFCESLHSNPDWREVVKNLQDQEYDFEVDGVRFIHTNDIQSVLEDELASDEYTLGCFNAWCIADATGWPLALIEAAQKGEQFEEIGKAMTGEDIAALAEIYASHDGYGHHFNGYDGSEDELPIGDDLYHVFDNH